MSSDGWPSGTVTFLFTDVEGSTERWRRDEAAMSEAIRAHDGALRTVVADAGGVVFKHTGDGVIAAFGSPTAGVSAAVLAQKQLELPVRMGLHTGEAELRDGDYFGTTMNRAARVMDAGHGGQVLVSASTASLLGDDVTTLDLGLFELKGLDGAERLFQVGDGSFPLLRARPVVAGNLPRTLSEFIGRRADIDRVVDAVLAQRVVTLFGVGGTGKTRLAIEAGRRLAPTMDGGCWFVDLGEVTSGDVVPFAVANGLGVRPSDEGDVLDDAVRRVGDRTVVVVMDNCEHLLDDVAAAVERLTDACVGLRVVATSREPLMVPGEHVIPVGALAAVDALALFVARARAEAPGFELDDVQLAAVGELCRRLDGLPLAIELAAARVRSLTPVDLLDGLAERFRLLTGSRRSRAERHQTMRATLDWSYGLCDDVEQGVFDELSVFPTVFDLDAAAAVAGDGGLLRFEVTDVVARLVDRSLLQASPGRRGGAVYRMLETMRAYGRGHLHENSRIEEVRDRHAQWVSERLDHLSLTVLGPDEARIFADIVEFRPDVVVAFDRYLDQQNWDAAIALIYAYVYPDVRTFGELANRLHRELSRIDPDHHLIDELESTATIRGFENTRDESFFAPAWASIDAAEVVQHRESTPPATRLGEARDLDDHELERIARFVRLHAEARPLTHLQIHYPLGRGLAILNPRRDLAEEIADAMERYAEHLDSNLYRASAIEIRANLDAVDRNWAGRADKLAKARPLFVDSIGTDLHFRVVMMDFEELASRARSGTSRPAALVDAWERLIASRAWPGLHRATMNTAAVLEAAGNIELAQTFVASAYHYDRGGFHARAMNDPSMRVRWPDLFGFDEDPNADIRPVDDLIERLRQLADEPNSSADGGTR